MNEIDRLQALDACAISDALDRLGRSGAVTGIVPLTGPAKIAGRVVTVKLSANLSSASPGRHLGAAAVDFAKPGDVIVVEHRERDDCAGWGGILSTSARARGIEGTIIDGLARDIDESRDAGYPVFARGATPRTARGRVTEEDWNVTITIGGVAVHPGDAVIADGSGVVFIASDQLDETLVAAEAIAARERAMAAAIRKGKPVSQVMGGEYETMLGDLGDD